MNETSYYYARNGEEKKFDDEVRNAVRKSGTKSEMALYLQNQTIINMLRHIEDCLKKTN